MNRRLLASLMRVALALGFIGLSAERAYAQCTLGGALATWNAASGVWSTAANWTTSGGGTAPPNTNTNTCITTVGPTTVTAGGSIGVANLQLAANNTLALTSGTAITVNGTQIINNGAITINSGPGNTVFQLSNSATLSGSGAVTLSNNSNGGGSFIQGNGVTLTNTSTIQGRGTIGNGNLILINQAGGVINGNDATGSLGLNGSPMTNQGLLLGSGGGTLQISTIVNNSGGTIRADGGAVLLNSTIRGGTLTTINGGTFSTNGSQVGTLDGVTNGNLTLSSGSAYTNGSGSTLQVLGTIVNNGDIRVVSGPGNSVMNVTGPTTLTGGGTITLSNPVAGGGAFLQGNNQTLNNFNNTIQGRGTVGNGNLIVINEVGGVINANDNTGSLGLNSGLGLVNQGLLTATGGGTLQISTVVNNSGGLIRADNGTIFLNNVIQGGTLTTVNGGTFSSNGTATLDGVTNGNLTLSSGSVYTNGSSVNLQAVGTIVNNGDIRLVSGPGNSVMTVTGPTTLTGGGTLTMSSPVAGGSNFLQGNNQTLINVNNTIQGRGTIGNGNLILVNQIGGVVNANDSTGSLGLNSGSGLQNQGLLTATGGGTLQISTVVNNSGGLIRADNGTIFLNSTIQGGTLTSLNGGTINTNLGQAGTLDGVTNGQLTLSAGTVYVNGTSSTLQTTGTIVNNGDIQLTAGPGNSIMSLTGNTTLSGGGTVTMTNPGGASSFLQGNNLTLTNASNTIQGRGTIGNGNLVLNNQAGGTVLANVSGQTLLLNGGNVTNSGTFQANAGSLLHVFAGLTNVSGTAGVDMALTGGTYHANGGTIQINSFGASAGGGELRNNIANIILNGASGLLVDQNGNRALRNLSGNQGGLTVTGGRVFSTDGSQNNNLINTGSVFVGAGSTINIGPTGNLSYTQNAGSTTVNGAFNAGGSFSINGSVFGDGGTITSANSSFGVAGILNPGANATTPGTLTFMGPLDLQGTLNEVLTGVGPGQFGVTNVTGTLTLGPGSTLNLASSTGLLNGSTAAPIGSVLTIVTNGGPRTGTFANVTNANFNNGQQSWGVIYNANNVQLGSMANAPIDATWTGPSGTWTANSGASAFTTNWACSIGGFAAPVINGCVPNNGRDGLGNSIAFANANYNAILNSAGNTMTLNSAPGGIITVNSVNNIAGNLVVSGGLILNAATFTNAGNVTIAGPNNAIGTGAMIYTQTGGTTTVDSNLNATVNINGGTLQGNNGLTGQILGNTTIAAGATLMPGGPGTPGTLRFTGNLNLNGSLAQTINGIGGGSFGLTNVSGAVNLGASSTLDLSHSAGMLSGATVVPVGSLFTFLTAGGGGSGTFSQINNNSFNNGSQSWSLVSGPGALQLGAAANAAITATWNGASGNWTNNANWNCSIAVINGCLPNNGRDGAGNAIAFANANYNVNLNSAGNTMTLSNTSTPSTIIINSLNNLAGTLNVDAAFLTATSTAAMTNAGTINALNGGVLTLGSTAINNAGGTIHSQGQVIFTNGTTVTGGTVSGFGGSFSGATTIGNGTNLLVGLNNNTPTGLSFSGGTLTLATGSTTTMVLNNTSAGSGYSVLSLNGQMLSLGSGTTLNLLTNGSFNNGDMLTLALGGAISGTFSTVNGLMFNSNTQQWLLNYLANSITLTAQAVSGTTETATWTTGTGNWDDAVAGRFTCTGATNPCMPNNNVPVNTNYNVVLNSAGNTLTLDNTSSSPAITVNQVTGTAGTLLVGTGGSLTTTGTYSNGTGATLELSGGTVNTGGAMTNAAGAVIRGNGVIGGAGTFTNNGEIYADNGVLDLSAKNVTNLVGGTLTGGVWQAGEFGTGSVKLPGNITTNAANIIIQNAGSQFLNAGNTSALAGLATNQGFLTLFDGTLTTGSLTNDGGAITANFGGSLLTVNGSLTNQNSAALTANGGVVAVTGNLANNSGSVTVDGGTLNITGSLTNGVPSSVLVQNGGALQAGSVSNSNTFITGSGLGSGGGNTVTISGLFTNNGSGGLGITGTGDNVSVGGLTNLGTVTVHFGTLQLSGGVVDNSNTFSVLAGGTLNTNGRAFNQLAGGNSFAGSATTGAFTNSGGATNVLNGGGLGVTTLNTSAALNVNAGGTLTTSGASTQTAGNVIVAGQLTSGGSYNLTGGTVTLQAAGAGLLHVLSGSYSTSAGTTTTVSGTLSAPAITNAGSLTINGIGVVSGGSYTQSAGTTQVLGNLLTGTVAINGGQLNGTGHILNATTIGNGASLLAGTNLTTSGTLNLSGPLTLANGSTLFQVINNGTQGSGYSFLNLGGLGGQTLTLGATSILNLQQLVSFNPANGTVLTIASFGSLVGQFGSIVNQTFNGGTQTWAVNYLANAITLTAQNNGAVLVNAIWNGPSGNWTNTAAGRFQCAPGPDPCLPNNNINNTYDVTLNSVGNTLTLDGTSSPTAITINSLTSTAGVLSIGSGANLTVTGTVANNGATSAISLQGGTLTVSGAMTNAAHVAGFGTIDGAGSFASTGSVQANVGGTLDLSGKSVTNLAGGILTGGRWTANGGILKLPGNITTNAAEVELLGAGSQITNAANGNALAGLAVNQGILRVGNSLTTTTSLNNSGQLSSFGAGTVFTVGGSLTNTAAGTVGVGSSFNTTGVSNAGAVTVFAPGALSTGAGVYSQSAGSTTVDGSITANNYATTGGTTTVNSGGLINVNSFSNNGGTVNVNTGGNVAAAGSYTQGTGSTNVAGTVTSSSYSQSAGTTTVNAGGAINTGGYSQTGGVTDIQISGTISTLTFAVNGGTATVNGQLIATGGVSVGSGGTLNGSNGSVTANVTNGGSVYGGTSLTAPGTLNIGGDYTQTAGGAYYENISSTSLNSQLFITGLASLTGALHINLLGSFIPTLNDVFVLMTYSAGSGNFTSFTVNGNGGLNINANSMFAIAYNATDVTLTVVSRGVGGEVPEPGTWVLVGTGALFLIRRQLRNRQKRGAVCN